MDFTPIDLSLDDILPTEIELVMGYRGRLSAMECTAALGRGLRAFPHLMGKLEGMRLAPSGRGFNLESVNSTGAMRIRDMENMPLASQSAAFIPEGRADSLFAARLTYFPDAELSVMGMRVSHVAVDGTGLALFINECTAEKRGVATPPYFHERRHAFGTQSDCDDEIPEGYIEAGGATGDYLLAASRPSLFTVASENVRSHFQASTLLDARLKLGAWLGDLLAADFPEVALWCDPRGLNGIPATYTGNVGCYLPFANCAESLKQGLKAMATRSGFLRIADTHRRIKLAESRGHPLLWDAEGRRSLQLNLVPHAVAGTDFGVGLPEYAALLSRNSSGLRISLTPDTSRFLVESCLPGGLGDKLLEKSAHAGLAPSPWCRGGKA